MCNKISTNSFRYSKSFFINSSITYFKILYSKLTFANLTLETNIFLLLFLNFVNFFSIIVLLIPRRLLGFTVYQLIRKKFLQIIFLEGKNF